MGQEVIVTKAPVKRRRMDREQAQRHITQINQHAANIRALLWDLYSRKGWRALGYKTWRQCLLGEFDLSPSYLTRVLQAAQIERELLPAGNIGTIPEKHLRPLSALNSGLRLGAWELAKQNSPDGKLTEAVVEAAVQQVMEQLQKRPIPVQPIGADRTEQINSATGEIVTIDPQPDVAPATTTQDTGESETPASESDTSPAAPDATPAPRPEPTIQDVDPNGVYIIKDGVIVLDPYENKEQVRADYPMGDPRSIGITVLTGRGIYERHQLGTLNAKLVWPIPPAAKVVDPALLPLSETDPASMKHHKGDRAWCASCDSKGLPAYHSRWLNAVADIWHCLQCNAEYADDVMQEDDMTVSPLPSRPAPKPAPAPTAADPLFVMISNDDTQRQLIVGRMREDELVLFKPNALTDLDAARLVRLRDGINALLDEFKTQRLQAAAPQPA